MQSLRQIGAGLLLSAFSVVMVLGGLLLALVEGGMAPARVATAENAPTGEVITAYPTLPLSFTNTPRGPDFKSTASLTPPPTLINCPPPAGWYPIVIQPYDTLASLAQTYNITIEALQKGNCLLSSQLIANSIVYVPALPTSTLKPCGAPADWGTYTVVAGDTLYGISLRYRIGWQELMQANCLDTTYIKIGQVLRVPNVPISTDVIPTSTPIPTATTIPPVITLTPAIPTPTDVLPLPTSTETLPATTEVPSPTSSPLPSETPTLTETPTL